MSEALSAASIAPVCQPCSTACRLPDYPLPSASGRNSVSAPRLINNAAVFPAFFASCASKSDALLTGMSLIARITSPGWIPARCAGPATPRTSKPESVCKLLRCCGVNSLNARPTRFLGVSSDWLLRAVAGDPVATTNFTLNRIYVDNVAVYQVASQQVNTSLTLSVGAHRIVLVSYNSHGQAFNATRTITVH